MIDRIARIFYQFVGLVIVGAICWALFKYLPAQGVKEGSLMHWGLTAAPALVFWVCWQMMLRSPIESDSDDSPDR